MTRNAIGHTENIFKVLESKKIEKKINR